VDERIRRIESHRARAGDPNLFLRSWQVESPQRTVVLVHGFGEHSGRYEEFAAWLAARGCAVQAFDLRGHGLSQGVRGHVDRFSDYLDDLESVMGDAREAQTDLPLHLIAHSMGGLIGAVFLAERASELSSAVISAPALNAGEGRRAQILSGRLMRFFLPRLRMKSPVDPSALSTDPAVGEAYLADPLVRHGDMTVSLALELVTGGTRALPEQVDVPTLVLHGDEDRLCSPLASAAYAQALPRGEHVRYPGLRHEILNEPVRFEIYETILRWLEIAEEAETAEEARP
jgi:alpha-beta hydrolase superfamily lysophospholipase